MPAPWSPVVVAPVAASLAIMYLAYPTAGGVRAPLRLAAIRAALATGTYAVLVVELFGVCDLLTAPALTLAWLLFLLVTLVLVGLRRRRRRPPSDGSATAVGAAGTARRLLRAATRTATTAWRTGSRGERLLAGTVGVLVLAELVVALLAEPNNFDSQTYHLPKIEHWAAQGNLTFWATGIHRQVSIPPGAEYLLLHLRLLTGGDALHNLVQWAAGVGCVLVASRITAQLGGGRRAQLLTAFLVATTPMVTLQATSTQTDLVAAAWTVCVASLVLDGLSRRTSSGSVLALGAATGLTTITKTSGLVGAGPLLVLWGLAQLRLVLLRPETPPATPGPSTEAAGGRAVEAAGGRAAGVARVAGASLAILAIAAVITGPFLVRIQAEFGNPLGPPQLRDSIGMQRHDPAAILINAARIGHTALDTPLGPLRDVTASAITRLADLVGVDPQDRAITFGTTTFPVQAWYPDEDRVSFPLPGALALIAGVLALVRPRRITDRHVGALRGYTIAVGVALVLHVATIKWQPWGNRLLLYCLVLAVPVAGLWLDAMLRRRAVPVRKRAGAADGDPAAANERRTPGNGLPTPTGGRTGRRSVPVIAAVLVLATSALAGVLAISYGFPRRLVGTGSLLTNGGWDTRFLRRPQWADEFRWAAQQVSAAKPRRIGLIEQYDNWEYPWWVLRREGDLGGDGDVAGAPEIVSLVSFVPKHPPADPRSVDAIICTGNQTACKRLVPRGWRFEFRDYVGYALPPR